MASKKPRKNRVPRLKGSQLNHVAFPLGGLGAGMFSLEGTGAFSQVSLRHHPDVNYEPIIFGALWTKGAKTARVLEGSVPMRKALGSVGISPGLEAGLGLKGRVYGLPRYDKATFSAKFPFATVELSDPQSPLSVRVTGWSPFTPGGATDDSCLPVAGVEYRFVNQSDKTQKSVFSFHAENFMKVSDTDTGASIGTTAGGFVLRQAALDGRHGAQGDFAVFTDDPEARVDAAWFRGGWFDPVTMVWNSVSSGACIAQPPHSEGATGQGGSIYLPFTLKPGESKTVRMHFAWYVPESDLSAGKWMQPDGAFEDIMPPDAEYHKPWYASQFSDIEAVCARWRGDYARLREDSTTFSECFFDTTLPAEVVEAVSANLSILKSPTCLRQFDGRFWGWEGCQEKAGSCHGSCTHVWNYAQAMAHLFPDLERTLRETELRVSQNKQGHQRFRTSLPIRPTTHIMHAAADGQLGGVMKLYREWRISGDTDWLRGLWKLAERSLAYCIKTWDPDHTGTLIEPHHNTYDIEFWGADGMCTSFYLGALAAAVEMAEACGTDGALYAELLAKGRKAMESDLWNGQWFFQNVQWKGLHSKEPDKTGEAYSRQGYSPEALEILQREGPKYQYGTGCLSDGVLGDWIARCCGVTPVLEEKKIAKHLDSVFKHNYRESLVDHANPQRPGYAFPQEGGLLLCSWPKGGKPSLPFVYSDEVWTGIEYQVASHLAMMGRPEESLAIIRTLRKRYDGNWRNPFDEYECGHWYARALASYGLLQAYGGARFDARTGILHLTPAVKGDYRAFLCTATGYGTVGLKDGLPFVEVVSGEIPIRDIVYAG